MLSPLAYTLLSVGLVSVVALAGAMTLSMSDRLIKSLVFVLVSLSAGALFGDAFIHLIPESLEGSSSTLIPIVAVLGIFTFFVLEKFLAWRHSHGLEEETVEAASLHNHDVKPLGPIVLLADAIHNFVDGVIIAVSFLVSTEVGIATTAAVVLHEIPQEIGDFALLLHAGFSRSKALFYNFLSGIIAFLGAITVFLVGSMVDNLLPYALAFSAGSFIYIAGSDLVPEIHKTTDTKKSLVQVLCMLLGLTLMVLLLYVE